MAREIDNVYKRRKLKEAHFKGKRSTTDQYTNKPIYDTNRRDAVRRHPTDKVINVDHITPIDVIKKRYPNLSEEQLRELANKEYNLAFTNEALNKSKGAMENHEYLLKQLKDGNPEDLQTTVNMLSREAESRVRMRIDSTPMYIELTADNTREYITQFVDVETLKELNQAGLDSASVAAVYAGTMSIVRNTIKVAKGEEEAKEAVMQVVTDTSGAAITAYATGVLSQALTNQFGNVIPQDATMLITTGTFQLSKQVLAYVSGELSEEQFKQNVAETAAYMTASYIGRAAGTVVGAYIPVVGPIVGPIIGEMIATAVCEQVISAVRFSKEYEKKSAAIISACHNAEQEILDSQERLKALIEHENVEFRAAIEKGCSMISEGILGNSCSQVEDGLAVIGEQFGLEHAAFEYERTNRQNLFKRRVIVME